MTKRTDSRGDKPNIEGPSGDRRTRRGPGPPSSTRGGSSSAWPPPPEPQSSLSFDGARSDADPKYRRYTRAVTPSTTCARRPKATASVAPAAYGPTPGSASSPSSVAGTSPSRTTSCASCRSVVARRTNPNGRITVSIVATRARDSASAVGHRRKSSWWTLGDRRATGSLKEYFGDQHLERVVGLSPRERPSMSRPQRIRSRRNRWMSERTIEGCQGSNLHSCNSPPSNGSCDA